MHKSVIGLTHRPTSKEKAAQVVAHLAAEKPFNVYEEKSGNHARCGPANDPRFSISWAEVIANIIKEAFPQQSVRNGMPNRWRRVMHYVEGLIRAVARYDVVLAYQYLYAIYLGTAPTPKSKGAS